MGETKIHKLISEQLKQLLTCVTTPDGLLIELFRFASIILSKLPRLLVLEDGVELVGGGSVSALMTLDRRLDLVLDRSAVTASMGSLSTGRTLGRDGSLVHGDEGVLAWHAAVVKVVHGLVG